MESPDAGGIIFGKIIQIFAVTPYQIRRRSLCDGISLVPVYFNLREAFVIAVDTQSHGFKLLVLHIINALPCMIFIHSFKP